MFTNKHSFKISYDRLTVAVRKRPMNDQEIAANGIDLISVINQDKLIFHEPKSRVDMSRYIENNQFRFDYVFNTHVTNEIIYK